MDNIAGIPNRLPYFEELFALHIAFSWEENVERLVEATNAIVARDTRFIVTEEHKEILSSAPERAAVALETQAWSEVEQGLSQGVEQHHQEILQIAQIDNVNIRGNKIEQIVTGEVNAHSLGDFSFKLTSEKTLVVDIKTKLLDRSSAPKAYNIDKFLHLLSQADKVFAFFFIGLDVSNKRVVTRLVSVFDPAILNATRIQYHWAGRSSRGVTQLTGDMTQIFLQSYKSTIDIEEGKALLRDLIQR